MTKALSAQRSNSEDPKVLWITESKETATLVARALGGSVKGSKHYKCEGGIVTWARGGFLFIEGVLQQGNITTIKNCCGLNGGDSDIFNSLMRHFVWSGHTEAVKKLLTVECRPGVFQ